MKLTLEASALSSALKAVSNVIEKRNTIPILSNVYLHAAGSKLILRGTDLDLELTTSVAAEVATNGETTVDAHRLHQVVSRLPKGIQATLEIKDHNLILRAGRSRVALQTLPTADFPEFRVGDLPCTYAVSGAQFQRILGLAQFAISTEETRYYLNGIYLHVPEGRDELVAVATDGHRLALIKSDLPAGAETMPGIIVPRKTVGEVLRLFDDTADIEVAVSQTKIAFTRGDTVLASKLIDGTFPDYGRVVPLGNDKRATADVADFKAGASLVSVVNSERGNAVKLSFQGSVLTLSVKNPDAGAASQEVEVDYDADPIDIGFNSRYLSDILGQCGEDRVEVALGDPASPALFKPSGAGDREMYVLMPMRVA